MYANHSKNTFIEQSLIEIWSHALYVDTVSLTDNFFNIGGDSLSALIVIDQIKQRLGWEISLGDFVRYPTILDLVSNRSQPHAAIIDKSIIRMSVKGGQTPCIFIHPVGGLIFAYSKLVKNLGNNRSCYGIQSLAIAGLEVPKSIEQMAEVYSDLIYNQLSIEEFNIIGWSSGGIIAFEIARIAAAKKLNLQKIVLIDSYVWKDSFQKLSEKETLRDFYTDLTFQISPQNIEVANKFFDTPQQIFHELSEILFGRVSELKEDYSRIEFIKRMYEAYRWNVHALSHYQATPANVSCLLLHDIENNTVDLWKELSKNEFISQPIPCGHYGLLEDQYSFLISEKIRAYIEPSVDNQSNKW